MSKKDECPKCNGENTYRHRYRQLYGGSCRAVYLCFDCNKYWYISNEDTPPWGIKHECDRWGGWGPDCRPGPEGVRKAA